MYENLKKELVDDRLSDKIGTSSHIKAEWSCSNAKHPTWKASFATRLKGHGCPYCSGRLPVPGESDLKTLYPDLYHELVDKSVNEKYTVHSGKCVEWQCPVCNNIWETTIRCRTEKHVSCPVCSERKIRVGQTVKKWLVKDVRPDILIDAVDKDFVGNLSIGSDKEAEFICSVCRKPHTYKLPVRKYAVGQRCPIQAGKIVVPGINDLATVEPDLAKELVDQSLATQLSIGTERKVEWKCGNGHVWTAAVYSRTSKMRNGCPYCASVSTSKAEQDFVKCIKQILPNTVILEHDRVILNGQELDVVIPDKKLAIEFNGILWHSEKYKDDKDYHAKKTHACEGAGYQLLHIWEDDWNLRKSVVIRMLEHKLGKDTHTIGARKLTCCEINNTQAKPFLEQNHIQGAVVASRVVALSDGQAYHAVMCLRSPKNSARMHRKQGVWEIVRYATDANIPGGFSKLLKYAESVLLSEDVCLTEWLSFSSNDVSVGNMYAKNGFVLDKELKPDYKVVGQLNRWIREPKEAYQKKRFRSDDKLKYDPSWTESECFEHNDLYRIYDSGKRRWVKQVVN